MAEGIEQIREQAGDEFETAPGIIEIIGKGVEVTSNWAYSILYTSTRGFWQLYHQRKRSIAHFRLISGYLYLILYYLR